MFLDLRVRVELLFCPEVFLLRGVVVSTGRDFCPEGFYPARVLSGVLSGREFVRFGINVRCKAFCPRVFFHF